jgi:hypothetical protein
VTVGLALAVLGAQAPLPSAQDTVTYTVRAGDTLEQLSRAYLVRGRDWRALARLARVRDPRRLPVGRQIAIPRSWLSYTVEPARLASYRGTVSVSYDGRPVTAAPGIAIAEGAELATGANSFISLALADRSTVVIPSHSRVAVRQLRRILLTGTIDYRIEVLRGRLETKVQPVDRSSGRYRIETPISMTAVRGTEFRVTYSEDRAVAGTEVLVGTVGFSAADGPPLVVEQAFGATLDRSGDARLSELLDAPDLLEPGTTQTGDSVLFSVAPVDGAVRYRAVIAEDAGFIDNLSEAFSDDGSFAFADIPNGNLFVRVSAIDEDGLEGMNQAYSFRRWLASIAAQAEPLDDGYRFRWSGSGGGTRRYRFQLARDAADAVPVIDEVGLEDDVLTLRNLPAGVYYWRVGVTQFENGEAVETWTPPEKLTISPPARNR